MLTFYAENYVLQANYKYIVLLIAFVLFITLIGYILITINTTNKRINNLVLGIMLLVFMITALVWIASVPTNQISDFGNFWSRAPGFFQGDKLYYSNKDYFAKYAYQTGFMVYVLAVVKIFGYNIFAIQFLNVVFQTLTLLFTYLIVDKIFNNIKIARLSVLLLMIDLDWFALNSQASNQYLGSLLYLITFYLLMQDKLWSYILAGITLTGGCLIRPIGPVIIAGIFVFTIIFILMKHHNYKTSLKFLLSLAIYFVLFSLAGWGIKTSGINQYGLSNNDSEWKFLTGLNYQSGGTYSPDLNNLIDPNKTRAQTRKVERNRVSEEINYLNKNNKWLSLFVTKTQTLWSTRTLATDFTSYNLMHSLKTVKLIDYLAYIGSVLLIITSWIGSLELFRNKFSDQLYLLILPLLAFAVVQLLIEVQGRYRIEFLPIISVVSGLGFYKILLEIKSILIKRSDKKSSNLITNEQLNS